MLTKYTYQDKTFRFTVAGNVKHNKNVFTIIVGKNGTGKSRLLSSIVKNFYGKSGEKLFYKNSELGFDNYDSGIFSYKYLPKKIIAVSTSPFDRFPLVRNRKELEGYSYLGIRDLPSQNFGLAYLSKIIGSLIEAIVKDASQMVEISNILHYLGYTNKIKIRIQTRVNGNFEKAIVASADPFTMFEEIAKHTLAPFTSLNKAFFINDDQSISKSNITQLVKILKRPADINWLSKNASNILIDGDGIHPSYPVRTMFEEYNFDSFKKKHFDDLIFLLKSGISRLRDVSFEKVDSGASYSISEASSGEQSVLMSVLGIASQIEDNSIICIDEPEICLHPEWQERYIKILTTTFNMYKGCHFIIATHSPQIVSNLDSKNCYILSMETGGILDAKDVINRSADFQLAKVFNSPGFKNEYLTRIALNIFTRVSKLKKIGQTDIDNYKILKSQSVNLEEEDPVLDLFKAITEMFEIYEANE